MADLPPRLTVDKISNKIFDDLVNPKFPKDTNFELQKRYWSLAGEPATNLEFTHIPDQATLEAIKWDQETIMQAGSMQGFELVNDLLQLSFINKLMLMKSLTYTAEPNLMHMMMGAMPSVKASEGDRKPDNTTLPIVGDAMMKMLPRRGGY